MDLIVRESQLSGQLNFERTTLKELQKKLDAIDVELQSISNDEKRPREKQQLKDNKYECYSSF